MAERMERKGLGRGLSALLAEADTNDQTHAQRIAPETTVPIHKLVANPDQPRRVFDDADMADLTASIRERGIIQPIVVRNDPSSRDQFQIVAGERRWRAAQLAQLHDVPIIVRELSDEQVLEIAIIENIQRADLNAIEEAAGYRQLMDRFGHTQDKLASSLGKSRSHIANLLRLLSLPAEVQNFVSSGQLSAGHARAIVTSPKPIDLAKEIIRGNLSVRQAEALARKGTDGPRKKMPRTVEKDADTRAVEAELAAQLGMRVRLDQKPGKEGGSLILSYKSLNQLDELLQKLSQ